MSFGEALRRFREKAGLSQSGLAGKSGVPVRTIQGWEQDYRCPVSADFFRLAQALGVSADEFAGPVLAGDAKPAPRAEVTKKPRGKMRGG